MAGARVGGSPAAEFQQSGGVADWRVLDSGAGAWFNAPSHAAGGMTLAADATRLRFLQIGIDAVDIVPREG